MLHSVEKACILEGDGSQTVVTRLSGADETAAFAYTLKVQKQNNQSR